jgi:hypothetical protein
MHVSTVLSVQDESARCHTVRSRHFAHWQRHWHAAVVQQHAQAERVQLEHSCVAGSQATTQQGQLELSWTASAFHLCSLKPRSCLALPEALRLPAVSLPHLASQVHWHYQASALPLAWAAHSASRAEPGAACWTLEELQHCLGKMIKRHIGLIDVPLVMFVLGLVQPITGVT